MEQGLFEQETQRFISMIMAAKDVGRLVSYNGWLNGVEVIVIGYLENPGGNGHGLDTKPLAILCREDVFDMLQVQGRKEKGDTGTSS